MIDGESRSRGLLHLPASREDAELARTRIWQRVREGIREERRRHRRKAWLAGVSGALGGFVGTMWVIGAVAPRLPFP